MRLCSASLVAALALACGRSGQPTEEKALGHSGYVVDAPRSWTVETEVHSFYTIRGSEQLGVQITESFAMPPSVEELASQVCSGQKAVQETLPGGGFFVQCKGAGRGTGPATTRIEAVVPAGDGKSLRCHLETDREAAAAAAASICRSLRRK